MQVNFHIGFRAYHLLTLVISILLISCNSQSSEAGEDNLSEDSTFISEFENKVSWLKDYDLITGKLWRCVKAGYYGKDRIEIHRAENDSISVPVDYSEVYDHYFKDSIVYQLYYPCSFYDSLRVRFTPNTSILNLTCVGTGCEVVLKAGLLGDTLILKGERDIFYYVQSDFDKNSIEYLAFNEINYGCFDKNWKLDSVKNATTHRLIPIDSLQYHYLPKTISFDISEKSDFYMQERTLLNSGIAVFKSPNFFRSRGREILSFESVDSDKFIYTDKYWFYYSTE